MHTTVMYRNESDCGMHNNVKHKWGLSNIHTTYTTHSAEGELNSREGELEHS